jgi:hypothetical protein
MTEAIETPLPDDHYHIVLLLFREAFSSPTIQQLFLPSSPSNNQKLECTARPQAFQLLQDVPNALVKIASDGLLSTVW